MHGSSCYNRKLYLKVPFSKCYVAIDLQFAEAADWNAKSSVRPVLQLLLQTASSTVNEGGDCRGVSYMYHFVVK
jgi:hypothetical protein